jgi:hypothetical protein
VTCVKLTCDTSMSFRSLSVRWEQREKHQLLSLRRVRLIRKRLILKDLQKSYSTKTKVKSLSLNVSSKWLWSFDIYSMRDKLTILIDSTLREIRRYQRSTN